MSQSINEQIVEGWDAISTAYQTRYEIPVDDIHFGPMCPSNSTLRLVPTVFGLDVVEIGCGGGQNLISCAKSGARRCLGIDPSEVQIHHARELAARHSAIVDFHCSGIEGLSATKNSFDLAIAVYSLMYVEDLKACFEATWSALRAGGVFIVSVDHPFRLSGEWTEQGFVVKDYFRRGWQSWNYDFPEQSVRQIMHRYHRTVSDWVTAFTDAGFIIQSLIEPLPDARLTDRFGSHSKYGIHSNLNVFHPDRLKRVPGTLILKGIRI